jgi:hypothetical protein
MLTFRDIPPRNNMTIDSTQQYPRCIICGLISEHNYTGNHHVNCVKCGNFVLTKLAENLMRRQSLSLGQRANISGYISENKGLKISPEDIEFLVNLSSPTVAERASRLLRLLALKQSRLGQSLLISDWETLDRMLKAFEGSTTTHLSGSPFAKYGDWFSWLSATWSESFEELIYLLESCLSFDMGLVIIQNDEKTRNVKILPKGWANLESMPLGTSDIGFVAMWFDGEVKGAWELALYPRIIDAGYRPLRIDQKQHNGKIDDEIVASIRAAKFVIADFTGQRGGVYFEAGLAFGLNKEVIWTVRADQVAELHFDTRQFNHIVWKPEDLAGFRKALQLRIEATLGKGPVRPTSV